MGAPELKEQGNALFKGGRFVEASELYAKAEKQEPTDPVYSSNLSAALYEAGDYAACFLAALRSLKLLLSQNDRNISLVNRLSIRIARALRYGIRCNTLSQDYLRSADAIAILEDLAKLRAEVKDEDVSKAWDEWEETENEMDRVAEGSYDARARLARLPIYKASPEALLEYYSISHDYPMSIIDDYGSQHQNPSPLRIQSFSAERLSKLAFLFGGVGDGRHVFGSIIGLKKAFTQLPKHKKSDFNVHMTFLDIHPTALARDLCILILLDSLSNEHGAEEQAEIKATLFYVYTAILVPSYCFDRFMNVVKDLRQRLTSGSPAIPSWIHVVSASIPDIIKSLDYWINESPRKTTKRMLDHHDDAIYQTTLARMKAQAASGGFTAYGGHDPFSGQAGAIQSMIDQQSDEEIIRYGTRMMNADGTFPTVPTDPAARAEFIKSTRKLLAEAMGEVQDQHGMQDSGATLWEKHFYKTARAFIPPPELRKRHPLMAKAWEVSRDRKAGRPKAQAPALDGLKAEAHSEVRKTWKPNPSLFDSFHDRGTGYPEMHNSGFDPIEALYDFNDRMHLPMDISSKVAQDCPSYTITCAFFDAVSDGLKILKDHIQLEILCGELNLEVLKMRTSGDQHRPAHFPKTFTRMWLSNVPDYTHGPLNMAVYVAPGLQPEPDCSVAANCLLNTPIWRDDDEFSATYMLVRVQDVPRYLGCRVLRMSPAWDIINLAPNPLPRPLHELASRNELVSWLTRVFFAIIIPGKGNAHITSVRYPNNLVAFIELLVHLYRVGFPAHWLADFLQSVISDSLTTDIAPYLGKLPIPVAEIYRRVTRRKVCLEPWLADLENILAMSYESLPFAFCGPPGFSKSYSEIGLFETTLSQHVLDPATSMNMLPPHVPVVSLIFYKPGSFAPRYLLSNLTQIIEGKKLTGQGELFVLTSVESFSIKDGVVRWRMSKKRIRKMKMQKWVMISYRFDVDDIVSHPDEARNWGEITET